MVTDGAVEEDEKEDDDEEEEIAAEEAKTTTAEDGGGDGRGDNNPVSLLQRGRAVEEVATRRRWRLGVAVGL